METLGLGAVFILSLIIANVLTACQEGGCNCGEYCVDSNGTWCNSDNDVLCSCKKGCLVFDSLLNPKETKDLYCNTAFCPDKGGLELKTRVSWCEPPNLEEGVHYPSDWYIEPNCKDDESELYQVNF
ncbi:hypothetical protein CHS0354_013731 [Potamilus streckersoni]|uniref:Uncharacterized protein n=1 Tax=Potamilus streckersoni TaxID=2493646 RepID=A0AAE0VTG6_9BIVA|nr:hypothetical protein CHS0354_013731 [Potamilus streckersoni]